MPRRTRPAGGALLGPTVTVAVAWPADAGLVGHDELDLEVAVPTGTTWVTT